MRTSKKWLDAQSEHRTGLRTLPSCLSLCDLKNDNYYKLVAAEIPLDFTTKSKLKVYKGTTLISEQGLPGIPSAIETFYIDEQKPKVPVIAVAIGSFMLFYRNVKPYYKYTLPSMTIEPEELDIWKKLVVEKPENVPILLEKLKAVEAKQLSSLSQELLNLPEEKQQEFIDQHTDYKLHRVPNITAMTTMKRSSNDDIGVSCLVIATESGDLTFLDCQAFTILHQARVSSFIATPTIMSVSGQFDIDFRMVIASREGSMCILRKGWLEGKQIVKLDYPVIGLAILPIDQTIIVVCMNNALDCYSKKGKRLWTVSLSEPALCMIPVNLSHLGMTLVCVALRSGLVQLYSQKNLVDQFNVQDSVSAMTFGKLGQEEHVLVLITTVGSLIVKILKRTAEFKADSTIDNEESNLSNSSGTLMIPKKTKIFIEQTLREKDSASAIHKNFQSDLWRFRLTAARATVDIINSAESTISGDVGHAPIKLAAEVLGLGPVFRLFLVLENMAARKEAANVSVLLHADSRHYLLEKPFVRLPSLVPGVPIKIDFKVTAVVDPNDGLPPSDLTPENAFVRALVIKFGQAKPLIAATLAMPAPEPMEGDIY